MLFRWLRNRRRRKLLDEPFPARWEQILRRMVWQYERLSEAESLACRQTVQILIGEKTWEGCGGLMLTEEIRVTIAGIASLPILACDHDYYSRVDSILVYPRSFASPNPEDGWEDDDLSEDVKDGMAVYRGPVLLSWEVVQDESANPKSGHSVVIHEFVHQIDFLDYDVNGAPPIKDPDLAKRWQTEMASAFRLHQAAVKADPDDIYLTEQAAESETEFFADAAEAFFCDPDGMNSEYPGVYRVLSDYFRIDPAKWIKSVGP